MEAGLSVLSPRTLRRPRSLRAEAASRCSTRATPSGGGGECSLENRDQCRKISCNDLPELVEIDVEVRVREPIAGRSPRAV